MDELGQFLDAGSCFLFDSVGCNVAPRGGNRVGELRRPFLRLLGIAANAQVDVERIRVITELEQNIPERQTVLPAGDRNENPVCLSRTSSAT